MHRLVFDTYCHVYRAVTLIEHPPDQLQLLSRSMHDYSRVSDRSQALLKDVKALPEASMALVSRAQWVELFGPGAGEEVADYFATGGRDMSMRALLRWVLFRECDSVMHLRWRANIGRLDFTGDELRGGLDRATVQARLQVFPPEMFDRKSGEGVVRFESSISTHLL